MSVPPLSQAEHFGATESWPSETIFTYAHRMLYRSHEEPFWEGSESVPGGSSKTNVAAMKTNSQMIVMQEGPSIGVPVWKLGSGRNEQVVVCAPARLAIGDDGNPREDEYFTSEISRSKCLTWRRTFSHRLAPLDFLWTNSFAIYRPAAERDLNLLCAASQTWGGCVEVISPCELTVRQLARIATTWTSTSRRVRYLSENDLCEQLDVPWLYLLTLYNFDPSVTVFLAKSPSTIDHFRLCTKMTPDYTELSLEETIDCEQADWEKNYRVFESQEPDKYWTPGEL